MEPKQICTERYAREAGFLAYLGAKLDLTAQQRPLWDRYHQAMLDGTKKLRQVCLDKMSSRGSDLTALQRRDRMEKSLTARLDFLRTTRPALEALYQSLSPEQRALLDQAGQHSADPGGHSSGSGGHVGGGGYGAGPYNPSPGFRSAPSRPIFGPSAPAGAVVDLRGRDPRQFTPSERALWMQGRWYHGRYFGRVGWWWFVAGYWYWYEEPFYPYPEYVSEYAEENTDVTYYYCGDPEGYYPNVVNCNVPWVAVPATPP